ncbi:hypothetical protein Y032_0038g3568 [Ancylostoma ceylanicum]|uniref:G-protein coupled receptors family 1 profile domain-containing protein n=1 Tax=Ancylostoma ceylanicum TaxID=53326 RepID=A0A016UIK4_9BILA|nr:hypothetical protein Y032_0038g3568 [Ancylostoma ceylanicum]
MEILQRIATLPRYAVFLVHWLVSLLLVIPILTLDSIRFGCVCKQMVAIDPDDFWVSTINSEVVVLTTFLLCVFFYVMTIHYVYANRKRERQLKAEIRLCVPVAALVFAFFLIFLYHLIQLIWVTIYHEQYRALRVLEPLFSGFLSFFTPWMLILSNREIASLFASITKVSAPVRRETTHRRTGDSNFF